ncbi:MAG: hypothetical protein JRI23_16475 [Deltaproteobacteria bacterium]|jgi:hypothetical protein|nr:hypothetical protein [Deltaproteobacteria bacterium]MBW2533372.1 hypothetical protein [Deltaproteobacteria bacterium]
MRSFVLTWSIGLGSVLATGCIPVDAEDAQLAEDCQGGGCGSEEPSDGKADAQVSREACVACIESGGGAACASRCPAGECRQCVESRGGTACLVRCREEGEYDPILGDRFAAAAEAGSIGYSQSACYEYVWAALRSVLGPQIESLPIPPTSAYQFGEWVIANPDRARAELHLERIVTAAADAPRGSVIVWPPGVCGYNCTHGHIEIALGDGTACSDFCGAIAGCTAQVFMPVQ